MANILVVQVRYEGGWEIEKCMSKFHYVNHVYKFNDFSHLSKLNLLYLTQDVPGKIWDSLCIQLYIISVKWGKAPAGSLGLSRCSHCPESGEVYCRAPPPPTNGIPIGSSVFALAGLTGLLSVTRGPTLTYRNTDHLPFDVFVDKRCDP